MTCEYPALPTYQLTTARGRGRRRGEEGERKKRGERREERGERREKRDVKDARELCITQDIQEGGALKMFKGKKYRCGCKMAGQARNFCVEEFSSRGKYPAFYYSSPVCALRTKRPPPPTPPHRSHRDHLSHPGIPREGQYRGSRPLSPNMTLTGGATGPLFSHSHPTPPHTTRAWPAQAGTWPRGGIWTGARRCVIFYLIPRYMRPEGLWQRRWAF
jgi:hypothetical protein